MRIVTQAARCFFCTAAVVALLQPSAYAAMSSEELARLARNPVGNLISVPIQINTNLNFGPAIQVPTHNDSELGNRNWGAGPSFVGLHLKK